MRCHQIVAWIIISSLNNYNSVFTIWLKSKSSYWTSCWMHRTFLPWICQMKVWHALRDVSDKLYSGYGLLGCSEVTCCHHLQDGVFIFARSPWYVAHFRLLYLLIWTNIVNFVLCRLLWHLISLDSAWEWHNSKMTNWQTLPCLD
jgi:hypothetical protein